MAQQVSVDTDLSVWQHWEVEFHIGDVVRKMMKQRGWILDDLAKEAVLARSTVHGLVQGSANSTLDTVEKVAKALGVRVLDLYLIAERVKEVPPVTGGDLSGATGRPTPHGVIPVVY